MIRKSDVKWWILEARQHPEAVPEIVQTLADRLIELDVQNERLRDEIIRLQQHQQPAAPASAQVQSLQRQVQVLKGMMESQSTAENMLILLSEQLGSARMSVSRAKDLAQKNQTILDRRSLLEVGALLAVRPHDQVLALTNYGRGFRFLVPDIAPMIDEERWPESRCPDLEEGERLTATISIEEPPRFWTVATRGGYVQRFVRVALDRQFGNGERAIASPLRNDAPAAIVNGERGDIMLITRWGYATRFPQHTIETRGSIALQLEEDDQVVAAVALPANLQVLILTTSGHATRYNTEKLDPLSKPGAKSRRIFLVRDVLAVLPCPPRARLLYLSFSAKLTLALTATIPLQDRAGGGMQLPGAGRDPILAAAIVPEEWL